MLRLYRARFSTNVERVALALAHKGLEVESVEISYEDRSPVVEVSGQGLVPVLVDGDEVIPDSVRILRYLEEKWPDSAALPARRRRGARSWTSSSTGSTRSGRSRRTRSRRSWSASSPTGERIAALAARMRNSLDLFEQLLDGRDHLFGDDFSAADCAAFPFLKYAKLRDPEDDELFHRILEEHLQSGGAHPRLSAWIDRVNERPRA